MRTRPLGICENDVVAPAQAIALGRGLGVGLEAIKPHAFLFFAILRQSLNKLIRVLSHAVGPINNSIYFIFLDT